MNMNIPRRGPQLTKQHVIADIPYPQRQHICVKLDIRDDWKKFFGHIMGKDGITPRYNELHMCLFDREREKRNGSPTDALLKDWQTLRPTINDLLEKLVGATLYDTADYIHSEVLQLGSLKQPVQMDDDGAHNMAPPDYHPYERSNYPSNSVNQRFGPGSGSFIHPPQLIPSPSPSIEEHPYSQILDDSTASSLQDYLSTQSDPIPFYSYSDLEIFTNGFDSDPLSDGGRFLGKGGYGEVYLGILKTPNDTTMLAVKRFHKSSVEYLKQFKTELEVIFMNCHHPNLLSIKGICKEVYFCVVYEYMGNGTLEQRLAPQDSKEMVLNSERRLAIAIDVARGIARLHNGGNGNIVHRDVKPANILLDDSLNAKVGDYGLVRVQTLQNNSYTNTTADILGSTFYMPPEASTGTVSKKWDVYSFGVVLLELLFAKGPMYQLEDGNCDKFIEYIFDGFEGDPLSLLDPRCDWNPAIASQLLDLVKKCSLKYFRRPDISGTDKDVLDTLLRIQRESKRVSR